MSDHWTIHLLYVYVYQRHHHKPAFDARSSSSLSLKQQLELELFLMRPSLLALISLITLAIPAFSFTMYNTPIPKYDEDQVKLIIQSRQTSARKIMARRRTTRLVNNVKRACSTGAQASSRVYPKCAMGTGTGYASYPGW